MDSNYDTQSINLWFDQDSENYRKNEAKAYERNLQPCSICGRGISEKTGYLLMFVDGGEALAVSQWEAWEADTTVDRAGYMGCFLVGPECGPKLVDARYRKAVK